MEWNLSDEEKYIQAKKKVDNIKGFYGNLLAFVLVNAILIFINLYTSPKYLWFFWPLLWWGLGVLIHGLKVFELLPSLGKDWEERKIREFMEKEKQNKNKWK